MSVDFSNNNRRWNFLVFDSPKDLEEWTKKGYGIEPAIAERDAREMINLLEQEFADKDKTDAIQEAMERIAKDIDLGGALKKARLKITDNPAGVFDFGLASLGLIRLPEFYNEELANEDPLYSIENEDPPGVVKPDDVERDEKGQYFFRHKVNKKTRVYFLTKRQKGTTLFVATRPNHGLTRTSGMEVPEKYDTPEVSKELKFTSNFKKSYIEFDRKGGTLPYVDLVIPMQLFGQSSSDKLKSVLPALLLSNFLNRAGVQTRIYMTRCVMSGTNPKYWSASDREMNYDNVVFSAQGKDKNGVPAKHVSLINAQPKSYMTANPPKNRVVMMKIKDRKEQKVDISRLAQAFAVADEAFNAASFFGMSRTNNCGFAIGGETNGMVTYVYPSAMAWQFALVERWMHFCQSNKLYGDYTEKGSRLPENIGRTLAPMGRLVATPNFAASNNYDLDEAIKEKWLSSTNNPLGFQFFFLLDQTELALGTDVPTIVNRIVKRWKNSGYDYDQIEEYIRFLAEGIIFWKGVDSRKQWELSPMTEPYPEKPMESIPYKEEQIKVFQKQQEQLVSSMTKILAKLQKARP